MRGGRQRGLILILSAALCGLSALFWWKTNFYIAGFWDEDFLFLTTGHHGLRIFVKDIITPHAIGTFRPWGHQMHFLLGRAIFGPNPQAFHWLQLFLHLINTYLVFLLFVQLYYQRWKENRLDAVLVFIAALVALLWSIQSNFSQAVIWIAAANNTWMVLFFLLFLYGFLCEWGRKKVLFFYFMALMSKEFAVLGVPAIFCFSELAQIRRQRKTVSMLSAILLAYLIYFAVMNIGFSQEHHFEISLNSWEAIKSYIATIKADYSFYGQQMSSWQWATVLIIGLCFAWGGPGPLLFFGGSLLFLSFWPHHVRCEFLYLPLVGLGAALYLFVCKLFQLLKPVPYLLPPISALIILLLAFEWWLGNGRVRSYVDVFGQRAASYLKSEEFFREAKNRMNEPESSSFWLEFNQVLGPRGILFSRSYLEVFHREILLDFPCYAYGVSFNAKPRLSPEAFLRCPH